MKRDNCFTLYELYDFHLRPNAAPGKTEEYKC